MQSRRSKNTRGESAEERRFSAVLKEMDCCVCGQPGPSIVQHCFGKTFRHNKVLIGHWFKIPLCVECDSVDTLGGHKQFREAFKPQAALWIEVIEKAGVSPPDDVVAAIVDWGR